ncbi:hypothetical protein I2I05_10120 [Hymenobacter sp. BT683]|uniref:Lysoplasmalogenase n=1 Tax=Hymenobacter jeongseonensis TaxID=2791027 RepID=A0ABS0IHB2_9BACT|nr:hypothetical protein [Hymenobacter jeongseonensis]MBF9237749.1 hypothetical protein [Hymenobacter jeongseonensis]
MNEIMALTLPQVLTRLTIVPLVIAGIIGAVRFRQLPLNLRYLAGLLFFAVPINLLATAMMMQHRNNLFLLPVFAVIELGMLAMVYRSTLQSAAFTRAVPWLVGGFTAYVLFDSLLANKLTIYRPGQQVIQGLLVLAMVWLYFRKLLRDLQVQRLTQEPMFWVSAGLFVYFSGYLLIALFSNYLLTISNELAINIWAVNSLLFITLHLCYCVALWFPHRK